MADLNTAWKATAACCTPEEQTAGSTFPPRLLGSR
jgi:hypothetical protein